MAKFLPEDIKVSDNSNILNPELVYDGSIDGLPFSSMTAVSASAEANIGFTNVTTDFANQSSIKYKTNVESMTLEEAENILRMRPVTYDYKNPADGLNCMGLIVEEVADIQNWGVVCKDGEVDGLDYSKFVPQLIRLCQHQQEQINSLESKISELQSQIMEVSNNESGG